MHMDAVLYQLFSERRILTIGTRYDLLILTQHFYKSIKLVLEDLETRRSFVTYFVLTFWHNSLGEVFQIDIWSQNMKY
jgi:hypothetical protein